MATGSNKSQSSAQWDLRRLQLHLDKNKPSPIYVLLGEETFLLDQALAAIKNKILSEGAADFNFDSFSAPETNAGQVRDAVETLPMMNDRRLVLYRNVDSLKEEAWDELYPVIDNPIDTTSLVLTANKLDKRKKSFKRLSENAVFVDLKKPFENQIPTWIDYISYLNKVKFAPEAIVALQQLVGTNLCEINNEIGKIKQFVGSDKKLIGIEDVLKVVSKARIENVFNLTDAISRRDRAQALVCLANLLEQGQNEVGILALIFRQIRILASVCDGRKAGLSGVRLSQKVGVPEFFLRQYVEQSQKWDKQKIASTLKALQATDRAVKSSPVSPHIWLENFIVKTC